MKRFSMLITILILFGLMLASVSCGQAAPKELSFTDDFSSGDHGWTAGFADLPENYDNGIYDLQSGLADLPVELNRPGQGFRLSGSNRSDDLFMFITKKLGKSDGILPSRNYEIYFSVEFASDAFAGGIGAGGAPGESVYVKAGASGIEPEVVGKLQDGDRMLLFNLDKGAQSMEGTAAIVIGNVAKTDGSEDNAFAVKTLDSSSRKFTAQSDSAGNLWVFVGTDSAYEGVTTLYYTQIKVMLKDAGKAEK